MENIEGVLPVTIAGKAANIIGGVSPKISRILLFGSVARGSNGPESDIDLCIVVPDGMTGNEVKKIKISAFSNLISQGIKTGEDVPMGVTITAISEGELLMRKKRGEFYDNVGREGLVLYDRDARETVQ